MSGGFRSGAVRGAVLNGSISDPAYGRAALAVLECLLMRLKSRGALSEADLSEILDDARSTLEGDLGLADDPRLSREVERVIKTLQVTSLSF